MRMHLGTAPRGQHLLFKHERQHGRVQLPPPHAPMNSYVAMNPVRSTTSESFCVRSHTRMDEEAVEMTTAPLPEAASQYVRNGLPASEPLWNTVRPVVHGRLTEFRVRRTSRWVGPGEASGSPARAALPPRRCRPR